MHLCNIILDKKAKVTGKKLKNISKIHWLNGGTVKVKLIMPNGDEISGISEPEIRSVKRDEVVQFERIGFARCDSRMTLVFYFAHK